MIVQDWEMLFYEVHWKGLLIECSQAKMYVSGESERGENRH